MSRTIYKYPLSLSVDFTVELPQAHKVLHVATQQVMHFMWVDVDTDSESLGFNFAVAGTGHPRPSGYQYIGTWEEHHGLFVWHLFEDYTNRLELPDRF